MKFEYLEKRFGKLIEIRAKDGATESRIVRGYAALFNSPTDLGYVIEEIEPGAFDDVLKDDVVALFNHDPNLPLSRTGAGLTIGVDKTGLWYEFEAPNTSVGNDLLENIRTGVIKQSSYSFTVKEEKWTDMGKDKPTKRTILKFERLYDVSPVTYPANEDTTVATRSMKKFKDDYKADLAAMDIEKMKSELRKAS